VDPVLFEQLRADAGQRVFADLDAAGGYQERSAVTMAGRLRRTHPPELVAAALTQARLRERAVAKFGAAAARMYFTPDGLEQATRASVARLRAERFRDAGVRRVADLCCGVGADTLAFAAAGIAVLAVDRDPLTCAVLAANAAALGLADLIEVRHADVTDLLDGTGAPDGSGAELSLAGCDAAFLDPARRTARGRVFDPEAYAPPWSFALALAERVPMTAVKVAPGIPHTLVPARAEAAWISDGGDVVEAGVYFGALATASRRATLLPARLSLVDAGRPDPVPGPVREVLYEPDGAVIRAGLIGELSARLDARSIDPTIAYLTADRYRPTGFASAYQVTDVLPFHLKRLRALVRDRGIGTLTVKKRGSAIDPDELRTRLRPAGPNAATLVVTRVAGAPTVIVTRPLD
jgi:SAM-dependent methyltransferase